MYELSQLLDLAKSRNPLSEQSELISKAFEVAKREHQGQKRKNGEPYFSHPFEAAKICAGWGLDAQTIAATLLHDTLEDTDYSAAQMQKDFGEEVLFLVNGVTKLSKIKYRGNERQAETLKKMILALSEDIRVVFVKLADRMHNMRTLGSLQPEKQQRIALETAEIYAPLANRMGLGVICGDLEDLAFPYLYPKEFEQLTREVAEILQDGESYIEKVKLVLEPELQKYPNIKIIKIEARVKRMSSLYKKLRRYDMDLSKIYDLIALRIITERMEDCYAVLGVIHQLWPPLPGKIKDYIALSKPNGYRSLHTTVIGPAPEQRPTEFQIRTEKMHFEDEYGIAAHWAYQDQKKTDDYLQKKAVFANAKQLTWINQLKSWQDQIDDPDDFIASLKIDFFKDRIFVITPKGEAIDLPAGSTPVDFAYAIHSEVGDHCYGAKVNAKMVPLNHELQSGDLVEIVIQKNQKPNSTWLQFAKSRHTRDKIRATLQINKKGKGWFPFVKRKP